jgi:hypothetical protein
MGLSRFRTALAIASLMFASAGAALIACSSGQASGGGSPDASEEPAIEAAAFDASDASVPHDGSTGIETSSDARIEADAGETGDIEDSEEMGDGPASEGELDTGLAFADGGGFSGDCGVGAAGEPTDLRCTGLYSDWASKTVAADVKQYAPGLVLWSDGADKTRWITLPPGTKIDTSDMDEWTFPVGTKIWKEFRLALTDSSTETRIETRLLWKQAPSQWYRTTYRWTADGASDAMELTDGELDVGGTGYEIPGQVECDQCHNGRLDGVLGFEAVALSSPEASGLTMQALVSQKLLTAPPTKPIVVPGNAIQSAALGWIHMNCGTSCHNSGSGAGRPSGFLTRLDVATLSSVKTTDTYKTGWNVPTQNFTIADAAVTYRLHACDTGSSAAYSRTAVRTDVDGTPSNVQMPSIDTHRVDVPDLATMAAWINEGCDASL